MEKSITPALDKEQVLELLRDASGRLIKDVSCELYSEKDIETECGTLPIGEYITKVNLNPNFDEAHGSYLNCNILVAEFNTKFAFTIIEEVCTKLYSNLNEDCKAGLQYLKILINDDSIVNTYNSNSIATLVSEFKTTVKCVYKGVAQVVNKDLSKNLLTIDQMANNILLNCRQTSTQHEKRNSISSKELDTSPTYQRQNNTLSKRSGGSKLWKRNSKLTVSVSQVKETPEELSVKIQERKCEKTNIGKQGERSSDDIDGQIVVKTKLGVTRSKTREKKHPKRIVNGCKELNKGYDRLHSLNAGSWYKSIYKNSPANITHLSLEEIFTDVRIRNGIQEIELKNIFTWSQETGSDDAPPPLIFIQGLAGSGKTSLSHHFVFEWQNGNSEIENISDFDMVILIEAHRARSRHLREFLRDELLPLTAADMDCNDIIPWLKTLDILFIFDGYYEIESMSYEIIEDVLAKFRDQRIIITTRPEVHKDFVCMARRHIMDYLALELCGFDVPRLRDFTHKVFKAIEIDDTVQKTDIEGFLAYINGRGRVLDKHLKLPLTILLLLFLWKKEPDILNAETTATQLYEELYILYFYVLTERTSIYFKGISQISHVLESLLLYIGEKAWDMVKAGTTVISDDIDRSIREECEGRGIRTREILSSLHMYQIDNHPAVFKQSIAFQHNTQMYYLAATYLVDRFQRRVIGLQNIDACLGVEHVLMFIMGHLAYQNALTNAIVTEVFQIINKLDIDPTKYEFWWSMLSESRFHSLVGFYIAKEKLPQKHWQLNEVNVVRGLKLLAVTPLKLWSLIIDIPQKKEPHDIPEFLDALLEAGKQIKKRQKRIVKVDLHLRHHENNGHNHSDDFLRALHSWADLQSFIGHLGDQEPGEEIFGSYINLSIVHVRVSTMNSFHSLSASLKKIQKTVKTLHVTIALPKLSPPELMTVLKTSGNLEISVADMEDQYRDWLVELINKVCGRNGCWRLNLLGSRLTYDTVEWLVNQLKGCVHDKLNIETKEE